MTTKALAWVLASATGLWACGGGESRPTTPDDTAAPKTEATGEANAEPAPDAEPAVEKSKADLLMGKNAEAPARLPIVRLLGPGSGQTIPTQQLESYKLSYKVLNWNQMPEGAYIQFLLDNVPFRPVASPSETVKLSELASGKPLAEGQHILAMYVSAANHAAIKGDNGVAVQSFWVGKKGKSSWDGSRDPLLIMARPNGVYEGDAASEIVADYYLVNAALGDSDYSLRVTVTGPGIADPGLQRTFTDWRPVMVWGPSPGEHKLVAELIDPKGHPVEGPWNPTERTFVVK